MRRRGSRALAGGAACWGVCFAATWVPCLVLGFWGLARKSSLHAMVWPRNAPVRWQPRRGSPAAPSKSSECLRRLTRPFPQQTRPTRHTDLA